MGYLKEIFYVLTSALIIFLIMELIWPGIILAYINYNILLLIWLGFGIIILIKSKNNKSA